MLMASPAGISLRQVVRQFADRVDRRGGALAALNGLTLEIPAGEWLAVLGPSGSGKTTLLRLIAGLDRPTSGAVEVAGQPAATASAPGATGLEIAMVFQRDALLPHLTARENIALGLCLRGHGRDEIRRRVAEADALLRLGPALDRLPRALSGGERQRAALARAFVRQPHVLLLDEPFSSLDAPLRAELRAQVREFHRRLHATVVHVTHDQLEAMSLGQRVAVLRHGALQQVADPDTLYRRPANAFVAGFVGFPPMNLFRGTLARQGGAIWFHAGGTAKPSAPSLSLCLPETHGARLAERHLIDRAVIVGLRAEHIRDAAEAAAIPLGCAVEAVVEAREPLGADTHVRWRVGDLPFLGRTPAGAAPAVGARQPLIFDLAGACYFDAGSGGLIGMDQEGMDAPGTPGGTDGTAASRVQGATTR